MFSDIQVMAMFSDIQTAATAIQSSITDLATKQAAIKTSVETALADLAAALESNNQTQLALTQIIRHFLIPYGH